MALKIRRGTNAERTAGGGVIFAEGELIYTIDTDALYIGDGSTPGGVLLTSNAFSSIGTMLVADTINNELDLQRNLNLSGNNIVGTGNINITGSINASGNIVAGGNIDIGDNTNDTLTILAQVDSNITPVSDTSFDIGGIAKRWRNGYFTGLSVSGQIDAVAVNADIVANNSTVMVDVSANTLTGDLTGNVQGDVTGNVTGNLDGNVTGDVTGNLTGNVLGDLVGSVFADDTTTLVDGVAGVLRGDHIGTLIGNVKAPNGFTILNSGTNGTDASIVATLVGNVTGNVTGNLSGSVVGDVVGSVFADDTTLLVDGVNGRIPGSVISGTVTANLIGNVQGNVTGNVTGNVDGDVTGDIFTNSIDSADSSPIIVTPRIQTRSDLIVDQALVVGPDGLSGPETITVKVVPGVQNEFGLVRGGEVFTDSITVKNIRLGAGGAGSEINVESPIAFFERGTFSNSFLSTGEALYIQGANPVDLTVATFTGDLDTPGDLENPANFVNHLKVNNTAAAFGVPVKFPVVADDTARSTLVPSPEKGMVILMESGTTPAATNQLQYYNGTGWVNV